mgnify:CR=1 FL=1
MSSRHATENTDLTCPGVDPEARRQSQRHHEHHQAAADNDYMRAEGIAIPSVLLADAVSRRTGIDAYSILACYTDAPYEKIDLVAACNMQRSGRGACAADIC